MRWRFSEGNSDEGMYDERKTVDDRQCATGEERGAAENYARKKDEP